MSRSPLRPHPRLPSHPAKCDCNVLVVCLFPRGTALYKLRAKAAISGLRPVSVPWVFSAFAEESIQLRLDLFPASVLRAEILEIVLGLLLGVLRRSLCVRIGIQSMDRLVQAQSFFAIGDLATGHISV